MIRIKLYGVGGQGVVTAGKILSSAVSIYEDKYAITVPAYGHERRGAPVYTDVILDEEPILMNCFVYEPEIVVVLDETVIEKQVDVGQGKKEDTILILNTVSRERAQIYKERFGFSQIYYVDATKTALETIGVGIPNGAILGALAKSGAVAITSVEKALEDFFGEKAGAKNALAARRSYERTEKY